ncbi:hypothetical protein SJ05684_c30190 [Sinorhizobium sojae CCBAU 05684]|uniref:Uncharacterized protein n=1 Tax=Sinorhizobium sojae CCBAU 05684 TaxID=716928 RepID=A0A249PES0_9HYPH|nr:hypothetical protein [Sinorhizobium sojae]ASY64443.1 hypothetical protein SJ05684_c30190 [Sinorhizobium sojae CCBAU 05684]
MTPTHLSMSHEGKEILLEIKVATVDWDGTEMPDGAEPINVTCGQLRAIAAYVAAVEKERDELRAEAEMLQDILDSRPAINAGLPETYIRWSQSIYSGDVIRASLKGDA